MRYAILACALLLVAACSKQEKSEDKVGTAMNTSYSDVIGSDGGYIIENAKITGEGEDAVYKIANACKLSRGTSSVLIIHLKDASIAGGTILALQIPSFAEGSELEFAGEPGTSGFYAYGKANNVEIVKASGLISGKLRLTKKSESSVNLGLNRMLMNGLGEMEIIVANIDPGELNIDKEKKYAARYELPIVTLDEMIKMNTPA